MLQNAVLAPVEVVGEQGIEAAVANSQLDLNQVLDLSAMMARPHSLKTEE